VCVTVELKVRGVRAAPWADALPRPAAQSTGTIAAPVILRIMSRFIVVS